MVVYSQLHPAMMEMPTASWSLQVHHFVNSRYRYTYDPAGRKSWEIADGFIYGRYAGGGHSTQFQYDNLGQLKRARTHQGLGADEHAPAVPGRDFGFTFDNAGNRTGISVDETVRSFTVTASHAYQSRQNFAYSFYSGMADQSVTIGGVAPMQTQGDFFHHPRGVANQTSAVWDQATVASGTHSATIGQVVAPRNQSFIYDAAGNLLDDGVWRYYYDAVNRLRRMDRVNGITGLPSARDLRLEFRYDEQGRRVEKKVMERGSGSILSFQRFIYEGWNLVGTLEIEGEGTEQTAGLATRYVWRTGSADTSSFGLLMVAGDHDNDPTTLPRAYFTGYDGRGNLTSLAENRHGIAAAAWEYSPFGEVLRAEGSAELPHLASLGATFGFSTQYTDAETGLVYFGHRYYHPGMGRFLNKDPLGEAGGLNRYAYALNDPINRTDYRGLCYTGPVDSQGYRYFQSFSDGLIFGSAPEHDTFNRPGVTAGGSRGQWGVDTILTGRLELPEPPPVGSDPIVAHDEDGEIFILPPFPVSGDETVTLTLDFVITYEPPSAEWTEADTDLLLRGIDQLQNAFLSESGSQNASDSPRLGIKDLKGGPRLYTKNGRTGGIWDAEWILPRDANGLIVQQVDMRVDGEPFHSYLEAWEVVDGKVNPKNLDSLMVSIPTGTQGSGTFTTSVRAAFVPGATINGTMSTYNWVQGAPGNMGAGILWTATTNASVTNSTLNRSMTVIFVNGAPTTISVTR